MTDLRAQRFAALGKAQPHTTLTQALTRTVGIQAQQLRQAEVGLALQVPNLTRADLLAAYTSGDIVRTWGQRWTYQLFTLTDWALVIAARFDEQLPTQYFQGQRDLFEHLAINLTQRLATVDHLTKTEIDAQLDELAGHALLSQERYTIFQLAAHTGAFTFIPKSGNQYELYAQHPTLLSSTEAIQQLMTRYLAGFGPASLADFCKWAGLTISRVRPLWERASRNWIACGADQFLLTPPTPIKLPEVILTSGFDAALTGYVDKRWLVDPDHERQLWTVNGILNPIVILQGTVVGTWHFKIQGKQMRVTLDYWAAISAGQHQQIMAKLQQVADCFGLSLAN
ncbi:winged helix DNA-binding domain-containing protein [Lacticaseibacillus porcinae]|uniref:winged helix DNA-binding domain-containing protein n=1 Tax=Lacticaseibacillus porcinae TaxID=1123687 RepID=UPI000F766FC8|nr:winged helix DNA-binding domain-containing protein [Lacticaseibacillus porcinae]